MTDPPRDISQQAAQQDRQRFAELKTLLATLGREHKQQLAIAAKTRRRLRWQQSATFYFTSLLWLRGQLKREYQLAALVVAFFSSGALSFIIGATFSLSVLLFVGMWIGLAIVAFAALAHGIALPSTEFIDASLERRRLLAEQLQVQLTSEEAAAGEILSRIEPLAKEGTVIATRLLDRSVDLKKVDWRALRGIYFERFLRLVFEHLGYEVQITKTAGEQGVDLIVKLGERRIAIQAKGFAEKVDVFAVQEAYAGMAFYHCQGCAVITNATFTEAARALAKSVNCILIDGTQIPSLIDGNITL